jgi:HrpA-like RNA helicase
MPTLLELDRIIPQPWMSANEKKIIKETKAIDYIIKWITDRVPENKSDIPKIKSKGPGSKVLVLRSGTGSGKSTVLPTHLHNKFFNSYHKGTIVTEPTRSSAIDIPFQILKHNSEFILGENIGFQTSTVVRKPVRGVLLCTTGILLQFLKTYEEEKFIKKYQFIIVDEVHIRSIDTDMVLFYLKKLLENNYEKPECPLVILTSGTFSPKVFMDYFECPKDHFIDVMGMSYPIEDVFSKFNVSDYINYTIKLIEDIHINNKDIKGDILVFVQGNAQIKQLVELVNQLNQNVFYKGRKFAEKHLTELPDYKLIVSEDKLDDDTNIDKKVGGGDELYLLPIPLMSEIITKGSTDYMNLYTNVNDLTVDIIHNKKTITGKVSRKVIIGTNAVETGITINNLRFCIDTGFVNESIFDPNFGCQVIINKNVNQSSSRQRRGRVGREQNGNFYACYTKDSYDKMPELPFPNIVKEDISLFLLNIIIEETKSEVMHIERSAKSIDSFQMNQFDQTWYNLTHGEMFDASKLDFIQFPSADSLLFSLEKLHGLGFIDNEYQPTLFGIYASKFRKIKLENVRMILAGYHCGANILDLITITSFLQIGHSVGIKKNKYIPRNPLGVSVEKAKHYYHYVFADEFIEYLFIWNDFMLVFEKLNEYFNKNKPIPDDYLLNWAKDNGFEIDGLFKVLETRDEMIGDMLNIGLNPYYNGLGLNRGTYNLANILKRNIEEGIEEIKKIKQCIYEGYRYNLFMYDNSGTKPKYKHSILQYEIEIDSNITKVAKPKYVIVSNILVQPGFIKSIYRFNGTDVSVLDGYVDVDINFTSM